MGNQCDIVRDLLPLYIDGLSSEASNRLIVEHLETCKECQYVHKQMMAELDVEQVELKKQVLQQKKPFEKMNKVFGSYRALTKVFEWLTVLVVVVTIVLIGKGFMDYEKLKGDLANQEAIEQEQRNIMNDAFERLNFGDLDGLAQVSKEYENQIKYIAAFNAKEVEPLTEGFKEPKALYPIPYEKAESVHSDGQLITSQIVPIDYDIGTIAMEKDGHVVQFEYERAYMDFVERAFQTKHYGTTAFQIWFPVLIALSVAIAFYLIYRDLKNTTRRAQNLIS